MASKAENPMKDAAAQMETFATDAQKTVTDAMTKMTKSLEDVSTFGQENDAALVNSSELAAKAAEGVNAEVSSFTKKSFEEGVAAAKDLAAAKNLTELMEKQSTFMQSMMDGWMKQATKMNEMMVATSKDVMAPVTERMNAATDVVKGMAA